MIQTQTMPTRGHKTLRPSENIERNKQAAEAEEETEGKVNDMQGESSSTVVRSPLTGKRSSTGYIT